jgi:hypothetical protein
MKTHQRTGSPELQFTTASGRSGGANPGPGRPITKTDYCSGSLVHSVVATCDPADPLLLSTAQRRSFKSFMHSLNCGVPSK